MCGIAGFVGRVDRDAIVRMTDALAHRGPDGHDYHIEAENGVHLGHRRLAVIDIAGGHQPMWDSAGEVGIVFNGEIYNHAELRRELEEKGHRFRSHHSDTETLIYGYKEWGEALPERLNGMFAFAIYDRTHGLLFLARDRFGEKPLYYSSQPAVFAFASELTALIAHPGVPRALDPIAIRKLFAYGYIPAPFAFYHGCRKLPPGHRLRCDIQSGEVALTAYWSFVLTPDEALGAADEGLLLEELRHLLAQAVKRRLVSDVPLGFFLSGGVDSSAVVAFAAEASKASPLKTFTLGLTEPSFDESAHARAVADHLGTSHRECCLSIGTAKGLIPEVLGRLDEPSGDASILPTYMLSAFAREHVTVALSGDGADELFAGYDQFDAIAPARLYANGVPAPLHRLFRRIAGVLRPSETNMSFEFKMKRTLQGLSYPEAVWAPAWMAPLEPKEIADLLGEPVSLDTLYGDAIELWETGRRAGKNADERLLEFFTKFYLPDSILAKVDRASMMVALESRAVFLDNDLVDFCRRLPTQFKRRNGTRKYLLKKAVEGRIPKRILHRRKKGFGIPVAKWLRSIPANPPLDRSLGANTAFAGRYWKEHRSGAADHRLFLWTWFSAQLQATALRPAQADAHVGSLAPRSIAIE